MKNIKNILVLLLLLISTPSFAFMPSVGIWGVDSEDNGQPGRGFQIEAENGIIVFTYFGYRPDGSSTFYYASGPIVNNTFTAQLLDIQGGTTLGGAHQNAVVAGNAGNVTVNFTSGKHGIIAFPGEPQRAISKRPFGYADGPDGLLGTWMLTQILGVGPLTEIHTLVTNTGLSTTTGNGMVASASVDFVCELQVTGEFTGQVVCSDMPQITFADSYIFKFSGDRGTGTAVFKLSTGGLSPFREAHVLRTATKNGIKTGLNNGTIESSFIHSQPIPSSQESSAKEQATTEKSLSEEDSIKLEALKTWTQQAQAIMQGAN